MIIPTVGRIVHFTPGGYDGIARAGQPLAAIVAYVWSERMVNLTVFDSNGLPHSRTSITLLQDDDTASDGSAYCAWMPYQLGQAAKTEALSAALAASDVSPVLR